MLSLPFENENLFYYNTHKNIKMQVYRNDIEFSFMKLYTINIL